MALTVHVLIDQLLQRVRDPHATAHSRALCLRMLVHAEGLIAVRNGLNVETFTLTTEAKRLVYVLPDISERIAGVQAVRDDFGELRRAPWESLRARRANWFRRLGDRFIAYSVVGRDLLILTPGVDRAVDVTITATAWPVAVTSEAESFTLEDHWRDDILWMAEALLLLRVRRLDQLKRVLTPLVPT